MKTLPISGNCRLVCYKMIIAVLFSVLQVSMPFYAKAQNCTVNAGINQSVCGSSAILTGNNNGAINGSPTWSFVSGPVTPTIVTPSALNTSVTGMTVPGNYVFRISQPCQAGGTASQDVTVTAYPDPALAITSPPFTVCGNFAAVNTLTATALPPGWTGRWTAHERGFGNDMTSQFAFSAATSNVTTVQLIPAQQTCGNRGYFFKWTVTSPNGFCTYSRTVDGFYYPDISQVNFNTNPVNICGPGSAAIPFSTCSFWSLYLPATCILSPLTAPAGFTGTLTATIGNGNLGVSGFTTPGTYTFNVNISFPSCGTNRTYGPFTVNVGIGIPSGSFTGGPANFCLAAAPPSITFNFTVGDPTDSSYVEAAPVWANYVITGAGTTNRTITFTPISGWTTGEFRFALRFRSAADPAGTCESRAVSFVYIYDGIPPVTTNIANSTACIPINGSTASGTINLPNLNVIYMGANFSFLSAWTFQKVSGPAAGFISNANINASTASFSGLTAGTYVFQPVFVGPVTEELACSGTATPPTFTINIYNQQGSNAGTDQTITCIQNFPLAANLAAPPSVGTWSQVSGPTPMQFTNVNDPNAKAVYYAGQAMNGTYTFRWTISDINGNCPAVSSNVVITSISACAPLPVSLVSFTAQKQGTATLTEWSTATEQNTKSFIIEWSRNGSQWEAIGVVAAAGNSSSLLHYQYLHNNPIKGVNYYRLRQVDNDERSTLSRVVALNFSADATVTMFPNPVEGTLFLTNLEPGSRVSIYSADGKKLTASTVQHANTQVEMSRFSKGMYIITVTDDSGKNLFQSKVLKQ